MSLLKSGYNILRNIIMTLIMLIVAMYVGLYVFLSVPSAQRKLKERVCQELSSLVGGRIDIAELSIRPFSEVLLTGISLDSPNGERCVGIERVAAGIDLWELLRARKIVLNYAEIISLDVDVIQKEEQGTLNIQFLIDALSPKDKNKPSTQFDLRIRNIVVRESKVRFSRPWMTDEKGAPRPFSEIAIDGLRLDLSIPTLRNDLFRFDVRNMQFAATPGLIVKGLSANITYAKKAPNSGSDEVIVKDLKISLSKSYLTIGDLDLKVGSLDEIDTKVEGRITPSDLSKLWSPLEGLDNPWDIRMEASLEGKKITVRQFELAESNSMAFVKARGEMEDYSKKNEVGIIVEELKADIPSGLMTEAISLLPKLSKKGQDVLRSLGNVELDLKGRLQEGRDLEAEGNITTQIGAISMSATGKEVNTNKPEFQISSTLEEVELGRILSTDKIGRVSATLEAKFKGLDRNVEGTLHLNSDDLVVMNNVLTNLVLDLSKAEDEIDLKLTTASEEMEAAIDGAVVLAGGDTQLNADIDLSGFNPSKFGINGKMADCFVSGSISANTVGDNLDNITGALDFKDINFERRDGKNISLSTLKITSEQLISQDQSPGRDIKIDCDWLNARLTGDIVPSTLGEELKRMVASIFPTLIPVEMKMGSTSEGHNDFTFDMDIKGTSAPYVFFETPVRPLIDIPISGIVDAARGKASLEVSTPHLQQGKNKLLRDIKMNIDLDSYSGIAKMNAGVIFPAKKGEAEIAADIYAVRDNVNVNIGINPTMESVVKGGLSMSASLFRRPDPMLHSGQLGISVDILPSEISVNDKTWKIAKGVIDYCGKHISVSNFLVGHEDQYVKIDGGASESSEDVMRVKLNDIDLEYIFGILNINYVTFGGMASGEIIGRRLLTKTPEARTESLRVRDLSYNGAVLGNGDLASEYDASQQKVGIYGVIRDPLTRERRASIDGGIWVTRDSLSFGFDANRLNVGIMKPFVSAFCSDIEGIASGKCKLFGTFSDIDLVGNLKADTLSMKLDFTNTWYHAGNDSVFLSKGMIEIPPLTLYDDERHTAELSGWLKHRYFHDPEFYFRLKDAKSLLCYNTNERINPLWYGRIYGTGHAQINGRPGLIDIDMNMMTEEGSTFTYVISDAEDVEQSSFLSFTDRRKEKMKSSEPDSIPEYLKIFHKRSQEEESISSNVILSLKGTVTNDALVTLVMDPRAGDNITARGQGALQMDYNMASNDLRMIGTYVLDEGNYNFTLQDIIIKNFNIKKGSLIKFDGDPMKANLDIAATYRVNTNLTDLDKSFSTDKELNRTNVPVDAVLLVDGPMTNPDITFDIELPSLTSDVERKVKSIVSTNDMMSRQIIYLLALNRFYTPEYTGGQSNGSEWSSVASSTISSQLSNILSQMTDKLNVAPSFRSEKGDFSDMEFDLALSSRLLNNRLLINGNFGYRDRSSSNTQFVGDFDIEYLLSKNGNLRLKAYNHFNDQNYYLRSALTTQGVGVVFRKDFDRLFKRKKTEGRMEESNRSDSMAGYRKDIEIEIKGDSIEKK